MYSFRAGQCGGVVGAAFFSHQQPQSVFLVSSEGPSQISIHSLYKIIQLIKIDQICEELLNA